MTTHNAGDQAPKAPQIEWDVEERADVAPKEGHIRDNEMYVTAALCALMEEKFGGVMTHVKTSTNVETGEVTVGRALEGEPGAIPFRRLGAQNAGLINFWRPLHRLSLKVPANRQFNVTPFTKEVDGVGTVFVFPMNERKSVPRNLKEEADTKPSTGTAAPAAPQAAAPQPPTAEVAKTAAADQGTGSK